MIVTLLSEIVVHCKKQTLARYYVALESTKNQVQVITSVGTTRGQEIIRVVVLVDFVVVVVTFFTHYHFLEDFQIKYYSDLK